jgi:hypothetical protein
VAAKEQPEVRAETSAEAINPQMVRHHRRASPHKEEASANMAKESKQEHSQRPTDRRCKSVKVKLTFEIDLV